MKELCLIVSVFLVSCTSVSWNISKQKFQEENQPTREIRVVLFKDAFVPRFLVEAMIFESNLNFESQAGIRLKVIAWETADSGWILRSVDYIHKDMARRLEGRNGWDMAIAITHQTPWGFMAANTVGWIAAAIDDKYRRFIALREKSSYYLEHEVWHSFILSKDHSWNGIMSPLGVRLVPLTSAFPIGGRHLNKAQRDEVLRNKWRDFNKVPVDNEAIGKAMEQARIDWSECINVNTGQKCFKD